MSTQQKINALSSMFPNKTSEQLNIALLQSNGSIDEAVNILLQENSPNILIPEQNKINKCAGNNFQHICQCMCHSKGNVFHIVACCYSCDQCGNKIVTNKRNEHDNPPIQQPNIFVQQPNNPFQQIDTRPIENSINYESTCIKVANMVSDQDATRLASKHGLNIVYASWEDNARDKNSSYGPCISDMTLQVDGRMMPVIRQPNFTDLTWDVPMDKIPLVVGNEANDPLYPTNLKEYLSNLRSYLSKPNSWKGNEKSLYCAQKDSNVIMSSQACFLPVPTSEECKFNVAIMNYQSTVQNPAVLAIVCSSNGTSAQLLSKGDEWSGQKLYFNKDGKKASFLAQRLSDNRKERNVSLDAPITKEEKEQNMVVVIQVPLKQKQQQNQFFGFNSNVNSNYKFANSFGGQKESANLFSFDAAPPQQNYQSQQQSFDFLQPTAMLKKKKEKSNVEHAIIKVGESEGEFPEFGDLEVERDTRYPVRVTLQYYKATSNGVVDEEVMSQIASQLKESRKYATEIGSLVVSNSNRTTEFDKQIKVAGWWEDYWIINKSKYPHLDENKARELVFKNGRFVDSSLNEVENRLPFILSNQNQIKPVNNKPPVNFYD